MPTEYRVDTFNPSTGLREGSFVGNRQQGFLNLAYSRKVNEIGRFQVSINGNHPDRNAFAKNSVVEIWRRNKDAGLIWTRDFTGIATEFKDVTTSSEDTLTISGPDIIWLLSKPIVAYKTGTVNRSIFAASKAETIMKTLVKYNATTNGTILDGRLKAAPNYNITIATDTASGNTLSAAMAYDNLLASLQDLSTVAGGDFDLVRQNDGSYLFQFYLGQRGTDRSSGSGQLVFSLAYGNMTNVVYELKSTNRKDVTIVGGAGLEADRDVEVVTGANYVAGLYSAEIFTNASNAKTSAELISKGAEKLNDNKEIERLTFDVIQTSAAFYGLHYNLGDKVKAVYKDITKTAKITTVTVTASSGKGDNVSIIAEAI